MNGKIFVASIGFVVGGVAGFVIGGKTCADRYRDTIQELREELDEAEENRKPDISKEEIETYTKEAKEIFKPTSEEKTEYVNMVGEYEGDNLSHPFKTGDIYLISDDDFRKDLNYRDSETMTYYQEDHVLADSADMPVHDEEEVIGVEALDELPTTEEDYLYVSNDIENKMYEIIVEHNQSFYRDVLGMEV